MLDEVPWMDNQNKEKSKTKALNMEDFIGYPEKLLTENYFSEELRLSREIVPGFSVEFGRHAYDSAPIIGELVDINAWDRALDEREM